jgi:hypothetical protein
MIRVTFIASLVALLFLVLYLPSAYPPEHFLAQVRRDHAAAAALWDSHVAAQLLDQALRTQDATEQTLPDAGSAAPPNTPAAALAGVTQRLFNNPYVHSINALLLMAAFRLAAMLQWGMWWVMFAAGAFVDASIRRQVKAKQFEGHEPERFGAYLVLSTLAGCGAFLWIGMPWNVPLLLWPCVPVLIAVFLSRAWVNFHHAY